jgi:hypothetical protein
MNFDITLCKGNSCIIKQSCHRFTLYHNHCKDKKKVYESYFVKPPYKIDKGKFTCDMFWGDNSIYLLEQLKSIFTSGLK